MEPEVVHHDLWYSCSYLIDGLQHTGQLLHVVRIEFEAIALRFDWCNMNQATAAKVDVDRFMSDLQIQTGVLLDKPNQRP